MFLQTNDLLMHFKNNHKKKFNNSWKILAKDSFSDVVVHIISQSFVGNKVCSTPQVRCYRHLCDGEKLERQLIHDYYTGVVSRS